MELLSTIFRPYMLAFDLRADCRIISKWGALHLEMICELNGTITIDINRKKYESYIWKSYELGPTTNYCTLGEWMVSKCDPLDICLSRPAWNRSYKISVLGMLTYMHSSVFWGKRKPVKYVDTFGRPIIRTILYFASIKQWHFLCNARYLTDTYSGSNIWPTLEFEFSKSSVSYARALPTRFLLLLSSVGQSEARYYLCVL